MLQEVGERVRELRKLKGLSQRELAQITGISRYRVRRLEQGNNDLAALVILSKYLDASGTYLLHGIGTKRTSHKDPRFTRIAFYMQFYENEMMDTLVAFLDAQARQMSSFFGGLDERGNPLA